MSRGAPNPCREQHQRRLLNRLAYLLFRARRADGSLVVPEPEKIKYITLEIPKPENKNAPKKGEQTKTERRTPKALLHEETLGRCIYCGSTKNLTSEHVVPFGLGGDFELLGASCGGCRDVTSSIERRVMEEQFTGPRLAIGYPSRHAHTRGIVVSRPHSR